MLSIHKCGDAAWRTPLLNVVEGGTDIDNADAVHKVFNEALAFAKSKRIPVSSRPGRDKNHADRYLRTLKDNGIGIIPRYVRIFCTERLGLNCEERAPRYGFERLVGDPAPEEESFKHVARSQQRPTPVMRMS